MKRAIRIRWDISLLFLLFLVPAQSMGMRNRRDTTNGRNMSRFMRVAMKSAGWEDVGQSVVF